MTDETINTGLEGLTVAVSESAELPALRPPPLPPPPLTREGKELAKVLVGLPADKLTPPALVALARDFAMDIQPIDVILREHGLNKAQYDYLADCNEFFRHTLAQQAREWQGLKSTQDRLRAEAAAALEALLPTVARRIGTLTEKLTDVVEGTKLLASIAGVDNKGGTPAGGREGFTISIDLGADTRVTIGPVVGAAESADAAQRREVSSDAERAANAVEVQPLSKGEDEERAVRYVAEGEEQATSIRYVAEGESSPREVRSQPARQIKASEIQALIAREGLE